MNLSELAVIIGVAIAVFSPQKLPEIARAIGKCVRKLQSLSTTLQTTVNEQLQQEQLQENEKKAKLADAAYEKASKPTDVYP